MSSFAVTVPYAAETLPLARLALDNALKRSTFTATSSADGHPHIAMLRRDTYQTWQAGAVEAIVSAEFETGEPLDVFAIARHNLGSLGITAEVEIKPVGGSWAKVADLTPEHDGPIVIPFLETTAEEFRLTFDDAAVPTVAVMLVGKAVIMPRPLRASMQPLWLSRQTAVIPQESEGGNILGSIVVRSGVAVSPEWRQLPLSFYNATLRGLARDLPGRAVFFAWQPDEHPDEVIFGRVTSDPRGSHTRGADRYSFGFSMTGQAPL